MKKILAGLGLLVVASWAAPASATITLYTDDRAGFDAAIVGQNTFTEDFSTSVSAGSSIAFASGVTSTQGGFISGSTGDCNQVHNGHFHGRVDSNASGTHVCSETLDWAFPVAVNAIGFDISDVSSSSSRDLHVVLGDGSSVDIDIRPLVGSSGFLGFISDSTILSMSFINNPVGSVLSDDFRVDNLTWAQTPAKDAPEPGTLALIGFGLMGLGVARRRRKTA